MSVDRSAALGNLQTLRDDLKVYGPAVLRVRNKLGETVPFELNPAQLELHSQLENQLLECGWVRAIVLKGRQQGVSTYIAARYYQKTSLFTGRNTFILSHEQSTSDALFTIVDRFQRNAGAYAPHVGTSNAKELEFDRLESSYAVATAGARAVGRGKTTTLFHGSEVAFWPNASEHFAASVQTVPLEKGTEVLLESTSAGASGEFYERAQDAEAEKGDYRLIFLPWWLSPEYARDPEPGFSLSKEELDGEISEEEYRDLYRIGMRQMAWRRNKILELRDPLLFRREYPATSQDAWTAPPGHEPYIDALMVLRARKRQRRDAVGPLVIGVDPASQGGDRFAMCWRRGLRVIKVEWRNKLSHEEAVAWCRKVIDEDKPARMNIDAGNIGANIVSSLKGLKPEYVDIVRGVNFGGTSEWRLATPNVPGPYNRRAEMYKRAHDWLELPEGPLLPDDGALQADICAPKQQPRLDNFFMLESKIDMKKRGVRSPDLADAFVLTFAFNEFFATWHEAAKGLEFGQIDSPPETGVSSAIIQPSNRAGGRNSWMGVWWLLGSISSSALWALTQAHAWSGHLPSVLAAVTALTT